MSSCFQVGFFRLVDVTQVEAAFGGLVPAKAEGLDVGFDYLLIVGATAGKALDDELLQVFVGQVDETGNGADDYHVVRPVVARGAGQLLNGHPEAVFVVVKLKLCRVVDYNATVPDLFDVIVVGLLIEGDQHVQFVPGAEDARGGYPRLCPGGAAEDLGGEGREGLNVITGLGGGLGQGFGGGYNALAALTGESDYEIFSNQD